MPAKAACDILWQAGLHHAASNACSNWSRPGAFFLRAKRATTWACLGRLLPWLLTEEFVGHKHMSNNFHSALQNTCEGCQSPQRSSTEPCENRLPWPTNKFGREHGSIPHRHARAGRAIVLLACDRLALQRVGWLVGQDVHVAHDAICTLPCFLQSQSAMMGFSWRTVQE